MCSGSVCKGLDWGLKDFKCSVTLLYGVVGLLVVYIVVFPDHTHLLFASSRLSLDSQWCVHWLDTLSAAL